MIDYREMESAKDVNKAKKAGKQKWLWAFAILLAGIFTAQVLGIFGLVIAGCGGIFSVDNLTPTLSSLAFMAVGLLIVFFRPANSVGWILLFAGFGLSNSVFLGLYVDCHLTGIVSLPAVPIMAYINHRFSSYFIAPLFILLPFLFPTGRFLTRRWKRLFFSLITIFIAVNFITLLAPDLRLDNGYELSYPLDSPVGWTGIPNSVYATFFQFQSLMIILITMLAIASLILRFRRSTGVERQQMKWFTFFLVTGVATQIILFELPINLLGDLIYTEIPWFAGLYNLVLLVVFIGWPLVIGLTIFRYRLYDIDLIIRRTLIYGVVTVSLVAIYFGSVVLLQRLFTSFTGQQSPLAVVISTLLIAALFNPLRQRIQAFIDRRFYRRRYDAEKTLTAFGQFVRDETDLEALTAKLQGVVEETMQPERVSIWLKEI